MDWQQNCYTVKVMRKCLSLRKWRVMQGEAGSGLSETVRKYRQSVFKLNYKIKKNAARPRLSRQLHLPAIPATAAAKMAATAEVETALDSPAGSVQHAAGLAISWRRQAPRSNCCWCWVVMNKTRHRTPYLWPEFHSYEQCCFRLQDFSFCFCTLAGCHVWRTSVQHPQYTIARLISLIPHLCYTVILQNAILAFGLGTWFAHALMNAVALQHCVQFLKLLNLKSAEQKFFPVMMCWSHWLCTGKKCFSTIDSHVRIFHPLCLFCVQWQWTS